MSKWVKKLSKRELKHLKEGSATGRPTLRSLRENLRLQKENGLRCFECEAIARKVGVEIPSQL
jgi:hypothetical protein